MTRSRPGSRASVAATVATFAANGVAVGSIGGLMPVFADRWDVDARALGLLLVVTGLAALGGINLGGRMADHGGALRPTRLGVVASATGLVLLALAPSLPVALAVALVYGFGNGLVDCSMNVLAVGVEQARPRPLMSRFHACWSAGSFVGAGLVLAAGALWSGPGRVAVVVLLTAAALNAADLVALQRWSTDTEPAVAADDGGPRGTIPRAAWILATMAIGFGLAEGTAYDWAAVHVRTVAGLAQSQGAIGLAAFAITMVAVRSAGDWLVHRLGRRTVVRAGTVVAAVGYLVGVTSTALPLLLAGWALVGGGMALVAPQIYGLAGSLAGGRGMSLVVSFGYATMLVGPGVMGLLVHTAGIRGALVLPLAAGLVLSALAWAMPTEQAPEPDGEPGGEWASASSTTPERLPG